MPEGPVNCPGPLRSDTQLAVRFLTSVPHSFLQLLLRDQVSNSVCFSGRANRLEVGPALGLVMRGSS